MDVRLARQVRIHRAFVLASWLALVAAPAFAAEPDLLAKGTSLYKQLCSHCHGINMVNPGTSSYDLRKWPQDRKGDFISIVVGGSGAMPAWGDILEAEEIEALWAYVATRGGKESMPPDPFVESEGPSPKPELRKPGILTACLPLNGGAMSGRRIGGGAGLDYAVAAEVARLLHLDLKTTWFESELDEDSDPVREIYAMLAMGLCDVAPGYALYVNSIGDPPAARAAPPIWDTRPDTWRRGTQVNLSPVSATQPYRRAEIGYVAGPDARKEITTLDDLEGTVVGIQQGTLSGAIVLLQASASVKAKTVSLPPGPKFLWELEIGRFDATLVDVAAYDFHRRQNPITKLTLGKWRHPIGFNIGMVVLATNQALLTNINAAIDELAAANAFPALARREKATWAPPRQPWIEPAIDIKRLRSAR
jgi:ABC-type amino acid transport substrate-binding protein